jgi:hypothetical protein
MGLHIYTEVDALDLIHIVNAYGTKFSAELIAKIDDGNEYYASYNASYDAWHSKWYGDDAAWWCKMIVAMPCGDAFADREYPKFDQARRKDFDRSVDLSQCWLRLCDLLQQYSEDPATVTFTFVDKHDIITTLMSSRYKDD